MLNASHVFCTCNYLIKLKIKCTGQEVSLTKKALKIIHNLAFLLLKTLLSLLHNVRRKPRLTPENTHILHKMKGTPIAKFVHRRVCHPSSLNNLYSRQ